MNNEASRIWITYLVLGIFATQLIINAAALAVAVFVLHTIRQHTRWSKDYLILTKSYSDMVDQQRAEFAQRMGDIAKKTQQEVALQGAVTREEIRKSTEEMKQQSTGGNRE